MYSFYTISICKHNVVCYAIVGSLNKMLNSPSNNTLTFSHLSNAFIQIRRFG